VVVVRSGAMMFCWRRKLEFGKARGRKVGFLESGGRNQLKLVFNFVLGCLAWAFENAIKFTSGKIEKVWLSSAYGIALTNYNPFIFTVIRHPGERIASAYSTIMSRYGGRFSHNKNFSPTPDNTTDIAAWSLHFSESIRLMMNTVKQIGWNTTLLFWNVHIVPQVEFMRGLNISHIGCLHSINETLKQMHLGPLQNFKTNIYEHTDNMPTEKFASYDLVDEETKTLMKELYAEDYKLYEETCVDSNTK
jgi:hypothetical protein